MRNVCGPVLVLLFAVLTGCSYSASYSPSPYVDAGALASYRSHRSPEEIAFLKKAPDEPYVILGTIDTPDVEWTAHYTTEDLIEAMREEAASIGADAILNFRTEHNPRVVGVGTGEYYYGTYYQRVAPVPFKGLHAWGEAVLFVSAEEKAALEPE